MPRQLDPSDDAKFDHSTTRVALDDRYANKFAPLDSMTIYPKPGESASSPLVDFSGLNDNIIKGLTSLLSVKQEIESIAYTYGLWHEK